MTIRIWQDSPRWIRADLIKANGKQENLYSRGVHPTVDMEEQYNDAEDSVRFNYPELSSVPIERLVPSQIFKGGGYPLPS